MSALEVRELSKQFDTVHAVNNASFNVPFGAVTGFIGGNGSGKTTTMRMSLGLTRPTAGTVLIDGTEYGSHPVPRHVVGSALNRLGAHPGLSARRHLTMIAAGIRLRRSHVDRVLDMVGLGDASDRRVSTYSTGMKQRLALAAALLTDPPILVLDEPASGLDPSGVRWLRELLRDRADDGAAVFVSTHQLAELSTIVDHVVVIEQGHITASEPADELLRRTGTSRLEDAVFSLDAVNLREVS